MQPPSRADAIAWLDRMATTIRDCDPDHPITLGLHAEDLEEDRRLGPVEAARVYDFLSIHGYPVYARWAENPTDVRVLPFLALMVRWLGDEDVLFEEFGVPTIGLWRADGQAKPVVQALSAWRGKPRRPPCDDFSWVDIEREAFYQRPCENLQRLFHRFCRWWARRESAGRSRSASLQEEGL